jgi:uncharacterized protein with PIN domain
MNLFFDTSALVKLFHEEEGTEFVTALLRDSTNEVWMLDLTRVEYASALYRRFRNRDIDDEKLRLAIGGFDEQCAGFRVEPLSPAFVQEAERLLRTYGKTHGLRALDALHLAGFSLIAETGWAFVTADTNQTDVGRLLSWTVLNPAEAAP